MKCICIACNRPIEKPLFWNGKPYGKECWKRIVLPEIERMKLECEKFQFFVAQVKSKSIYEVVKNIDDQFIQSVCKYYEQKNFMSQKQIEAIYKKITFEKKIEIVKEAWNAGLHDIDIIEFLKITIKAIRNGKEKRKIAIVEFEKIDERIVKIDAFVKSEYGYDIGGLDDDEKEEIRNFWEALTV